MKRFWKSVTTRQEPDGWHILLDDRAVSTPARNRCVVPRAAIAAAIAREWDAQKDEVRPLEMPMTRTAATCLDRVAPHLGQIRETLAAYGETDLLCYRAQQPETLVARQEQGWDPVLDWAADTLGARLATGQGVMHIAQAPDAVANLSAPLDDLDPWQMTAMADLTQISGSLVLALAILRGRLGATRGWDLSQIDERWNIEHWGEDADAAAQTARRRADFLHAAHVLELLDAD